jgi:FkbM family methyltransferase
MEFFDKLRRVRSLHHLMPFRYAIDAAFGGAPRTLHAQLRATGRPFDVRLGTSDLRVLEQVFARQEYSLPKSVQPRTIIDAGANIGCATTFFANRYPDARIIAIEPDASNFEVLQANCAGFTNVTPVAAALWSHPATLTFVNPHCGKWAFSMKERDNDGASVRGVTIPQLIEEFSLDRIDVLKIDIEGGEKEVFSASDLSWLDIVGTIAIELHDNAKPGCAKALYSALRDRQFEQRQRGDLIFIKLLGNAP